MAERRQLRYFDYVNHGYERVRDRLVADPKKVFQAATKSAASRAHDVASALHVSVAGIEIGADVIITVDGVYQRDRDAGSRPMTTLRLSWQAAKTPGLFPEMTAELSIYPLTRTETQLDFLGIYEPPLGAVGKAIDAVVGHRIAEASVHRLVKEVAEFLRSEIETAAS